MSAPPAGASPRPVFVIADESLRDFVGHHFSYDKAVAEAAAAAGFTPLVLGHRGLPEEVARQAGAVPAFTDDIWARLEHGNPWRRRRDDLMRNRRFAAELMAALPPGGLPEGSILLAHMLTKRQLLGLAEVVEKLPRHVTTVALLRYQTDMYDDGLSARAFARMRQAVAAGARLRMTSDSERLARRIGRIAGMPVQALPIPHTPHALPLPPPPDGRPLHMVSLGGARDEKGIIEIFQAIALLRSQPEGLRGLTFSLQTNDAAPAIAAMIDAFALELPEEVRLVRRALSPAEYDALLASADLVLAPYWRDIYESRTSGVLLEAVASGRPVICTAATWLSDELAQHGAGILVRDRDAAGLAQAMRQAQAEWPRLHEGAVAGREACLARHGGTALIRALLAPPPPPPPPEPPRRVQVFYPWEDFAERRAGASLRSNMMAEIVAARVEELRVLQGGHAGTVRRGNILVEALHERRLVVIGKTLARRALRLLWLPLTGRARRAESAFPWFYLERAVDPLFRRRIERQVGNADAVLLEYGFWAGPVERICRRLGVPCVLTAHDVIEDQVKSSRLLHALTAWFSRRALRGADAVVAVTPQDAARFAALGVHAEVVPNPVDLDAVAKPLPAPPRVMLERLGISLPERDVCLFVGSSHPPNVVAAGRLRRLAADLQTRHGDAAPLLVVAGAACPPVEEPGFRALGMVHQVALAALYRIAAAVVIPLPEGTGSSLKTLEAMASGLPVLGTSVAFRGLPVTPEAEAVVEDDLDRWPEVLPALLADSARRARLGAAGRALAERYDYRRVMTTYLRLLGIAEDAAPVPPLPALAGGTLPPA